MNIRQVTSDDVKAITDIYNGYIMKSVASFETEPLTVAEMQSRVSEISSHYPYYVCEKDGKIAGWCYAHAWKERAAYCRTLETTVYVSPEFHCQGIGRKLMTHLIEECRNRGYHALIACITGGNEASISLHLELGFSKVSHFRQVGFKFGRCLDIVDYELLLI